jgi:trans-L-3-hydroxyproline dehydratase
MNDAARAWRDWKPGPQTIRTIDAHAEGEPLRVILDGLPPIGGDTILERRRFARKHLDPVRTALMWEPRGHADMYGCIVTPPVSEGADFGVLFLHNEGFSTMCGHGIIAVATVAVETGLVPATPPATTIRIDSPAGLVTAFAHGSDSSVERVTFHNVPSYVVELGGSVRIDGAGDVTFDLAFGGAFYAFVDAAAVGLQCHPAHTRELIAMGSAIKAAVAAARPLTHPTDPDMAFLYGTIFTGPALSADAHSRNVCIFADGEVDRSPTGTGVSARLAIHHARGELQADETITIESIIGSRFTGRVAGGTTFGGVPAIIPEVGGRAFITGRHEFVLGDADPLRDGFLLK